MKPKKLVMMVEKQARKRPVLSPPPKKTNAHVTYPLVSADEYWMVSHWSVADLSGREGRAPPLAQNFFIFMQVSEQISQIIGWCPLGNPGSATADTSRRFPVAAFATFITDPLLRSIITAMIGSSVQRSNITSGGPRICLGGGGTLIPNGSPNLLFGKFFPENCMKMKTFWPMGGGRVPCAP